MNLLLYSENCSYGERLYHFLVRRGGAAMNFYWATNREGYETIRKEYRIQGVITDTVLPYDGLLLFLCEGEEKKENEVNQYQKGEVIYQRIVSFFHVVDGSKGMQIVTVFSPECNYDKSEVARSTAQKCRDAGEVLYLPLAGFPVYFREEQTEEVQLTENGLSSLLFELDEQKFAEKVEECSFDMDGIRVISPLWHYKDLLDIEWEDLKTLFEYLRGQGRYQTVVIEMGQLFEYTFQVLEESDQILLPVSGTLQDQIRFQLLKEYLKLEHMEELIQKICVIKKEEDFERVEEF